MLPDFKTNRRIPEVQQVDFISSPDWPKVQELYQEFLPWKEAYKQGKIPSHSAQEYAIILFDHGLQARGEGNYGIAAMIIWRPGVQADADGKITLRQADEKLGLPEIAVFKPELAGKFIEMMVIGENSLFRQTSSNGHAERQSMEKTLNIWRNIPDENVEAYLAYLKERKELIFREAPDEKPSIGIVTTLEPCIGCTEMILTTGIDWVLSLNEDSQAGAMHPARMKNLPFIWSTYIPERTKINILFSQRKNSENLLTYLPLELASITARLFFETKTELDKKIGAGGTLMLISGVKKTT